MPALTVHNAEVKTAAVEVKTLTISGKQVTLAVFRQLKEKSLIAEDGTLNGVPWGTVNYHPDKCGGDDRHVHVVWQLGQELRRSRVDQPTSGAHFYAELSDGFLQAAYCLDHHQVPSWATRERSWCDGQLVYVYRFYVGKLRCETVDDRLKSPRLDGSTHKCLTEEDYASLRDGLRDEVDDELARRARIRGHWQVIGDLPQLFIAV